MHALVGSDRFVLHPIEQDEIEQDDIEQDDSIEQTAPL
jgi:hypothetical protein